ncbi:RloB domain-containing protein [Sphaerisporangium album]|uniref:RloB domain-containing protein n=1 Tax=Sphaerisporangium album TaxID=509200 RepID=A0A367FKT0_9ACTN|nr:RloB family protein [Sphaerisporangium album]RCG30260.1 RloB domain-containing protein [Sphaerisporangium album]
MSGRRSRGSSDLGRRRHTKQEKPRILIVTEGLNTEPQYFKGLLHELRATGVEVYRLHVEGIGRDPVRVVKKALVISSEAPAGDEYEQVWCVVDVDDHETLQTALSAARRASINVAVSNPCFEVWLLWHFTDHRSHVNQVTLKRKLRDFGVHGKNLPADFPYAEYTSAMTRAEACGPSDDFQLPANPSSSVGRLTRMLTR